ncbi:MAG: acetamidase/formamidase family protein [Fervidicoccaceae archaeon]
MMGKKITSERVFFKFDPDISPIAKVHPNESIIIETRDCFSNQIKDESQQISSIDFSQVNPATGPIFIEGAKKGDALAVHVRKIKTSDSGLVVAIPGEGFLGEDVKESRNRKCRVLGNWVEISGVKVPYRPMIGVIGVASSERNPTGVPGRNGGNLDTRQITEGATVYLPVEFEGALFGIGDLHAAMGDGEICVSGCEVRGEVELEFGIIENLAPPWPIVEYGDSLYIVVSAGSVEDSLKEASRIVVSALSNAFSIDWIDAYLLSSLVVDMQISQLVDPKKTVRARIPTSVISARLLLEALRRR